MSRLNNIDWTIRHKKAFLQVEKELLGHNTIRGYLHDVDKLFLYLFFSKEKTHNIHRKHSSHHSKCSNNKDYFEMVCDWECSGRTKASKILNAYDTLYTYFPTMEVEILPILQKYHLDHPTASQEVLNTIKESKYSFDFNQVIITNLFRDEYDTIDVNPVEYYGLVNVMKLYYKIIGCSNY